MPKVLLIDDEEGIRESLSIMLQIEGFETVALPDAVKAMQKGGLMKTPEPKK